MIACDCLCVVQISAWFLPCAAGAVGRASLETKALSMRLLRFNFPALLHLLKSFPQPGLIGHLPGQWQEASGGVWRRLEASHVKLHTYNLPEFVTDPHALHKVDHARSIDYANCILLCHTIIYTIYIIHIIIILFHKYRHDPNRYFLSSCRTKHTHTN